MFADRYHVFSIHPVPMSQITQSAIAKAANVSRSTVAKVLSNTANSRISEEVRSKVLKVAEAMDYRPNRYAQIMRGGKSGLIGIINLGSGSALVQRKVIATAHAVHRAGFHPLVHDALWFADAGENVCRNMIESRVEGVILVNASAAFEQKFLNQLLKAGIPVVSIGGEHLRKIPLIVSDRYWGYHTLTTHLLTLGYRHLAQLSSPLSSFSVKAFTEVLAEKRWGKVKGEVICVQPHKIDREHPSEQAPYRPGQIGMQEILRKKRLPEAILCGNDEWVWGALQVCAEQGIRVPEEVAFTGFEDEPLSAVGLLPLTSIAHPVEAIGDQAVAKVLALIEHGKPPSEEKILIKGKLIVRRSCGAYLKKTA